MAQLAKYFSTAGRVDSLSFNDNVNYTRTALEYYPPGIDSKPLKNSLIITHDLGTKNNRVIHGCRRPSSECKSVNGETRIYSTSGANLFCRIDGTVEINGDGKSFMTYEQFAEHWNNLIVWLSAHTHFYDSTSETSPPIEPIDTDISDISDTQTLTVKTDG